jgi:hypothetical protein
MRGLIGRLVVWARSQYKYRGMKTKGGRMIRSLTIRRFLVLGGVAAVAAAIPLAVLAATGSFSGRLDGQTARWTTTDVTTSSRSWRNVPGLARTVCTLDQVTATVSAQVGGGPVRFRVIIDGVPEAPMKPGSARFVPNGVESFSYTFVGNTAPFEADDTHRFNVQWRSPRGVPVRLENGALNLLFEDGTQGC